MLLQGVPRFIVLSDIDVHVTAALRCLLQRTLLTLGTVGSHDNTCRLYVYSYIRTDITLPIPGAHLS